MSTTTAGMTVPGGPQVTIKNVNSTDVKNAADSSVNKIKNAPGPRGKTTEGA